MNNILPYLAIFLIFMLKLVAGLSIHPTVRIRIFAVYIAASVALVIYLYYFDIPYFSGAHIITYCIVLPDVITRIINMRRIKAGSVQIKTPLANSVFGLVGLGIFLFISSAILYLMFAEVSSPKPGVVFDIEYFLIRLNFLLVFVSLTVWMYLLTTPKTTFYPGGLLHNGEIWRWSDFRSYSWKKRVLANGIKELTLTLAEHVWRTAQIKLKVPSQDKDQVDFLLEKNLEEI